MGCFLPFDPPYMDRTTIGGILAGNAGGPRRLLYGLPRDLALGIRFVAPNGKIIGAGGKTVKNVSGYDISKLMIGSYGTLGIICEATIRLLPLPEKMQTQLIFFNSLDKANSFVDQVFESSLLPAAVELINHTAYNRLLCEETVNDSFRGYIAALAYEGTRESVARMAQEMPEYAFKHDVIDKIDFQESEHIGFWQKMSNMAARLPENFPCLFTSRISYPLSHRSSMMHMVDETMGQFGIEHAMVTHAGSGVCFTTMLLDDTDSTSKKKAEEAIVIFETGAVKSEAGLY